MTYSSLTDALLPVPKGNFPRSNSINKVTVHHMAGDLSIEGCQSVFLVPGREASSNYGIDSDGRIGCYVEEENRAWTSGSAWNDEQAITIEVADYDCYNWIPSDAAYESTVKLCADICDRYGIEPTYTGDADGTFTEHRMFQSTGCPGEWWHAHMPQFIEDVKAAMNGEFMSIDELMNWPLATADDGTIPFWQLVSWAYTYAKRADSKCKALESEVAALEKKVATISTGGVDTAAIAKAVNDDAAKRLKA